ncbi:MAG: imidazole glycerol phosphate synthase subunit HisF [bacterium]
MLRKRIIPCLDVRNGKVTKGVKFKDNLDIGDPVEMATKYYQQGADELVFYDITASSEGRSVILPVVEAVAKCIFIPFAVGGGISTVEQMRQVLTAGAEKISVNSAAVRNPEIISKGARAFGNQAIVLGMDVLRVEKSSSIPSGYEVVVKGGREHTGLDAIAWVKEAEKLGVGEVVVNSIDADGTRAGYELVLTQLVSEAVSIPVVASGGAGKPEHLARVLIDAKADAALIASMTHYDEYSIPTIKEYLDENHVSVRKDFI